MGWAGAVGSIVGGLIGAGGSIIGGKIAADNSKAVAKMNIDAQKEFAQNGIRWKVEDAKRAGIHPLYSLGASTNSFTPVSGYTGDYGISDAANTFGQGIDRAIRAKMTERERQDLQAKQEMQEVFQLADMNMRKEESDAKVLMYKSEALRNYAASQQVLANTGLPPAMPSVGKEKLIPGQGDAPDKFIDKPIVRDGWLLDEKGRKVSLIPSDDIKSRTEDVFGVEWFPFIFSAYRDFKGRNLGLEIAGHKWDDNLGYIPVSDWNRIHKKPKGGINVQTYRDYKKNNYRYRW